MSEMNDASDVKFSRREAVGVAAGALLAGCAVAGEPAPVPPPVADGRSPGTAAGAASPLRPVRRAPVDELVNAMEFEEQAQIVLRPDIFEGVAGGDREPFNRRTLHHQLGVPTLGMDLGVTLFGAELLAPMIVGPIAQLGIYHAEAEVAMVRGAAEAYTGTIISSRSTMQFERLVGLTPAPLWYSVYTDSGARERAQSAAAAGAGAVFITVGAQPGSPAARSPIDWQAVDSIRRGLQVPVLVKGIRTPAEAAAAVERDVQGIVVSNHGAPAAPGQTAPMDALPPIVETVAGRVPVLIDGSFRRGSDVLMALIHGAQGVLIGRPAAWALAAYGSEGVRWLFELLQHELARNFGMLGVSKPAQLTSEHIRIHQWATA